MLLKGWKLVNQCSIQWARNGESQVIDIYWLPDDWLFLDKPSFYWVVENHRPVAL